jgi:two-component system NtrC family sensor kinase
MQIFYYLAAFLLINRLGKSFKFTPTWIKWRSVLTFGQWGVLAVYVAVQIWLKGSTGAFVGSALLLGVVWFINKEEDFISFKAFTEAHYPLIATGFINGIAMLVNRDFYDEHRNIFEIIVAAAFIWIFARWATTKKQTEEIRQAAERNAQLDILVTQRTAELTQQKEELEKTVIQLQSTQEQLIQSEKLASLGELTAGIAHEIQNPLNFVNNFSEVSAELVDEMGEELKKGDIEEAMAIAADIKQNLEKIRHHGQRADGIVKSMLQHSRASSGQKEPTAINSLADEYLRLAYHGLRAKDKMFNAEMVTHFAENLPPVNVVPQDVGRVLLNLFTNAFYAVNQRKQTDGAAYMPIVEVSTSLEKNSVKIVVKDNGTGMPENIKDKIMQPFFTTKPTGQGTGLGLSLSYDIVVKAHGGTINVDSKENDYTAFTITLPL